MKKLIATIFNKAELILAAVFIICAFATIVIAIIYDASHQFLLAFMYGLLGYVCYLSYVDIIREEDESSAE